jgi:hypothetical protein
MRMIQRLHAKRLMICVALLGLPAIPIGCGDSSATARQPTAEDKQQGEAMRKAMEAAYGEQGAGNPGTRATRRH